MTIESFKEELEKLILDADFDQVDIKLSQKLILLSNIAKKISQFNSDDKTSDSKRNELIDLITRFKLVVDEIIEKEE